MAEKGKGKGGGGGRKKPTGKALRYLFASGVLGKKKDGGTKYNKKRSKTLGRLKKRGIDTTVKRKYRNTPSGSTRPVIGGSKAAGLRSGAGGGAAVPKSRAERIAAGRAKLKQVAEAPNKKGLQVSGFLTAVKYRQPGQTVRQGAQNERNRVAEYNAGVKRQARSDRLSDIAAGNKKVQTFYGLQERLGRAGAIAAAKNRPARIAAGKAKAAEFKAKRDAEYNGGLFGTKPRAQRIAEGRAAAEKFAIPYVKRNLPGLKLGPGTFSGGLASRVSRGSLERTKDPAARFAKVREAAVFTSQTRAKWVGSASEKSPTPKPRPDYSSTRAARVAAGKAVLGQRTEGNRTLRLKVRDVRDISQMSGISTRAANKARLGRERQAQKDAAAFQSQLRANRRAETRPARIAAGKSTLAAFASSSRGQTITKNVKAIKSSLPKIDAGIAYGAPPSLSARVPGLLKRNQTLAKSAGLRPGAVAKLLKKLSR